MVVVPGLYSAGGHWMDFGVKELSGDFVRRLAA